MPVLLRPLGTLGSSNCTDLIGRRNFFFLLWLALGHHFLCHGLPVGTCTLTTAALLLQEASAADLDCSM